MRLWSLHPKYLDRAGLTAAWREALLAQAVLAGRTRGYTAHPQLERFRHHEQPMQAVAAFLWELREEATRRAYRFDGTRILSAPTHITIPVTSGQVDFEWQHLLRKLRVRAPDVHKRWNSVVRPMTHPLLVEVPGGVERWERP